MSKVNEWKVFSETEYLDTVFLSAEMSKFKVEEELNKCGAYDVPVKVRYVFRLEELKSE